MGERQVPYDASEFPRGSNIAFKFVKGILFSGSLVSSAKGETIPSYILATLGVGAVALFGYIRFKFESRFNP